MMRNLKILGCCALLVSPLLWADEKALQLHSGEQRVALIELFTSEGCSSCPPADRWLSSLKNDPDLFSKFVPLAFHVDYWDYIGWKDEFARAEFSARQRRYIEEGAANVVYTPGVFKNGKEWRTRRDAGVSADDSEIAGSLTLTVNNNAFNGRFDPASGEQEKLQLQIAILGLDLETQVGAGENRGKTLHHDFVVVGFSSVELNYDNGSYIVSGHLPETFFDAKNRAVAAWVSTGRLLSPIQAVGGFLPD